MFKLYNSITFFPISTQSLYPLPLITQTPKPHKQSLERNTPPPSRPRSPNHQTMPPFGLPSTLSFIFSSISTILQQSADHLKAGAKPTPPQTAAQNPNPPILATSSFLTSIIIISILLLLVLLVKAEHMQNAGMGRVGRMKQVEVKVEARVKVGPEGKVEGKVEAKINAKPEAAGKQTRGEMSPMGRLKASRKDLEVE
ncbi:hypothetical protein EJ04DRAFT_600056 [Polyplosphaeria fusca]|uniref:Uncharacterized protein n=1 Tax=Polyplosphaeria fusca TaxID=682080 RepID=A0A9P4R2M2_9PLEO|nr:hypothetical protein EJ04DRAFT_600056 [Polyplosphaeria fusca]